MTASHAAAEPHGYTRNPRHYKYYDLVMAAFVTVLLCSNLIGPAKTCEVALPFALPLLGSVVKFGAGNLFFPISYIFDDVLTEVYGYARSRKVIWAGFGAMVFATIMGQVVIRMPAAASEPYNTILQPAIETVFGGTWRIVIASMLGFWGGDFVNSYVLAKMKIWTTSTLFQVITFNWLFKVTVEVVLTPVTYAVIGFLKRAENEDYYDRDTDFTPFSLED